MAQPQNCNNNEDIPQLAMVKVDQEHVDDEAQCTTCLETFELDEIVAKLNCKHIFHRACIEPWLQRNNTCPICRTKIEWHRNMDAAEELMNHNIENGQAIFNAVAARILDTVYTEQNRQTMEDNIAQLRQSMDNLNQLGQAAMEIGMDNVNELNRRRQGFANAWQQMMVQFQEEANGEGEGNFIEMLRGINNLLGEGIRIYRLYWL